jgi:hypothetical protein
VLGGVVLLLVDAHADGDVLARGSFIVYYIIYNY